MDLWSVEDFDGLLAQLADYGASVDQELAVYVWYERLQSDPYSGARRDEVLGLPFWWCRVPGSDNGTTYVLAEYIVDEERRAVVGRLLNVLNGPLP